jgi:hypothetical protein
MKRRIPKIVVNPTRVQPNRPIQVVNQVQPQRQPVQINNAPTAPLNKRTTFSAKSSNRVFILGGGPSMKDMNLSFLKDEDVICVNKSIDLVRNPTFFITMDYSFFGKVGASVQTIAAKAKSSHFVINKGHKYIQEINGTYVDVRNNLRYTGLEHFSSVIESGLTTHDRSGFGLSLKEFCHGDNSGYCAIQFAILAGYREIYLLGFDLGNTNIHSETHFHGAYPKVPSETFRQKLGTYTANLVSSMSKVSTKSSVKIMTMTPSPLEAVIPLIKTVRGVDKVELTQPPKETPNPTSSLSDLVIVAYYTLNTPYEEEAKKLIRSLSRLGLTYDVVGVKNLGDWQANTRFKAKFMEDMLNKHLGKNLLYVDSDAIVHSKPILFENYDCDIAVRWQDFRWRQNECLSGTIFMANNEKTRELCKRWQRINISEGPNAKTFEQWNLGSVIKQMESEGKIKTNNLPAEYTFIFDSMRAMYPNAVPVIEHFQASRKLRNKL